MGCTLCEIYIYIVVCSCMMSVFELMRVLVCIPNVYVHIRVCSCGYVCERLEGRWGDVKVCLGANPSV